MPAVGVENIQRKTVQWVFTSDVRSVIVNSIHF